MVMLLDRNSDTSPSLFYVYLIACHPKCFHTPWGFLPYTLGNLGDRSDKCPCLYWASTLIQVGGGGIGGCAPSSYRDSYSPWRERYLFICCPIFVRGAALFCWYWIWLLFYKGFIGGLAVPFA
jgi:hypothetical protein